MSNTLIVGVVGKDGRSSAIHESLQRSSIIKDVVSLSEWNNKSASEALEEVLANARILKPDFVIIGPEAPLAAGVVDRLEEEGFPCVGPNRALAQLESSKSFTRELLSEYKIPGNPEYHVFRNTKDIEACLRKMDGYVVKPDGLTGGKGVKISDEHIYSIPNAVAYCEELFQAGHRFVLIEEKLEGEEFSLQSFCDGTHVKDMVVVQDHKRAYELDTGPNTGGMGSYSCEDHLLPFLTGQHIKEASAINMAVARALLSKTGTKYKGILYGGFMATPRGVRLIEYNARFGDPETLNVLPLLKTDFGKICQAIINESLDELPVEFEYKATVCKYIVPKGYPKEPVRGVSIDLSSVPQSPNLRTYLAAVEKRDNKLYLTGSRSVAFVGIGKTLEEAEAIAEEAASAVRGPVYHRRDIGTKDLVERRIAHMKHLCEVPFHEASL